MVPSVIIRKKDLQTGSARPSPTGNLAIIAPSSGGTAFVASQYLRADVAEADFDGGPLVELAAYEIAVAQRPVLLVKATASTPGALGTLTQTPAPGVGDSAITATGTPTDNFDILVTFQNDGVVGTAGITFTYSDDGGESTSAPQALGTANTIAIPGTGVTIDLGAGNIHAGETAEVVATAPKLTTADLTAALEALRVSQAPWEAVLIWGDADAAMVAAVDTWLAGLEAVGRFRGFFLNSRMRNAGETESAYATALGGVFASATSIRGTVGADGGDVVSPVTGAEQPRPTSLAVAARAMSQDIGIDPAWVSLGAVSNFTITDARGNPKYHDENLHPGLDDLRLATMRAFDGEAGAYINNAPVISPAGSDFVYVQHWRTMNRACETAWSSLKKRLSQGVRKQRKADPTTGAVYMAEEDAASIESGVNIDVTKELGKNVSGFKFTLSRNDDIGSNSGATVTGTIAISGLSYIKTISVDAKFVRAI